MSKNNDWFYYMGWKELNISIEEAAKWKKLIDDPDIVSGWIAAGFTSEEAEPFIICKEYQFSPNEARNWLEKEVPFNHILECAINGISIWDYDDSDSEDPCANGCGDCRDCETEVDGYYGI